MATKLLISVVLFSLLPFSSQLPTQSSQDAAEILTNSGFTSMALTLELASQSLFPQSSYLTIFAPSDTAFAQFGQPPLALLQYHLLPLFFSLQSLKSLPYGAKIATVLSDHFLTVTTASQDGDISLNNVTVEGSPIYDDGSLTIFAVDQFFDPSFENLTQPQNSNPNLECLALTTNATGGHIGHSHSFDKAFGIMRPSSYHVMASFLELQFLGVEENRPFLTIFAPSDTVLMNRIINFSDWSSIFHRHVVPCKLLWNDLVEFNDGTELRSYLDSFEIRISRSGGILMLNDVPIIFPDMYYSDWFVVHGISEILEKPKRTNQVVGTLSSSQPPLGAEEISGESEFRTFYNTKNANENANENENENATVHYRFSVTEP